MVQQIAKAVFAQMGQHVAEPDLKIDTVDRQLREQHKVNALAQYLAMIPGIGSNTTIAMRFW